MTDPHEDAAVPFYHSPLYRHQLDTQSGFGTGQWFGQAGERLWVGAAPRHAADYAELRLRTGATHILNVANDDEAWTIRFAQYDHEYLRLPVADTGAIPPDDWFTRGVQWALDALADPDAVVYVHCLVGSARGPAMAYAILRRRGMSARAAGKAIRRARPMGSHYYLADAERWANR